MGLFDRIRSALGSDTLDTWLLSGRERTTGHPLTLAFSGTPAFKEYHAELAFGEPPRELSLGAVKVRSLDSVIAAKSVDCAISFVELDDKRKHLARWIRTDVTIPVWMQLEIELKESLEASLRRSRFKSIRKMIAHHGLSYEIRTDDATFDEFYRGMYLPHIQSRHGSARVATSYHGLKDRYHHGELVMIKHGGNTVAGSIIDFGHPEPRMLEMGVRDGDERYLKLGVSEAVYWFSFERILQKGGGRVRLGNSRSYLRDGALRYKVSVGARFAAHHYPSTGLLHVRFHRRTPGLDAYLMANPCVIAERASYFVCGFIDRGGEAAVALADEMQRFQGPHTGHRLHLLGDIPEAEREELKKRVNGCDVRSAVDLFGRHA